MYCRSKGNGMWNCCPLHAAVSGIWRESLITTFCEQVRPASLGRSSCCYRWSPKGGTYGGKSARAPADWVCGLCVHSSLEAMGPLLTRLGVLPLLRQCLRKRREDGVFVVCVFVGLRGRLYWERTSRDGADSYYCAPIMFVGAP